MEILTRDELVKLFLYDALTGVFTYRIPRGPRKAGAIAGHLDKTLGYTVIRINRKLYLAHRLVWLLHYDRFPEGQIDHINHDRTDNRIANLRDVTSSENHRNRPLRKDNTSGYVGIHWYKAYSKWQVQIIGDNGDKIHLGYFSDILDAKLARETAELKYNYHVNHGMEG